MAVMSIRALCIMLGVDRPEAETFIGLHKLGVHIRVLCAADSPHFALLQNAGIPLAPIEFRSRLDRRAIEQIRSELSAGSYDILHLLHNEPVLNGLIAARGHPELRIIVYRGIVGNVSFLNPLSWMRYLNPRVDRIICVAEAVREYFLKMRLLWLRVPPNKPVTIHKGHDVRWYQTTPADLQELDIPAGAFIVGCVANWRPRKGIEVLIDAFRALPADAPIYLLLVGDMASKPVDRAIAASPARERIRRVGFRRDAPALVAACDVAVLPSLRREGLPRSIIEAMAYAVPPVVTDSGGSPELIVHGESGLIVPPADSVALAEAFLELYQNSQRRRRMGESARRRIVSDFNIETTIAKTARLYQELTCAGPSSTNRT